MSILKSANQHLLTLLTISFFCLSSCSSEDGEQVLENNNVSRELLIGTWETSTATVLITYTFNDDGTGIKFGRDNYTWRLDANVLTITRNGRKDISQIIEIDNQTMLLQDANGGRAEFTKQ